MNPSLATAEYRAAALERRCTRAPAEDASAAAADDACRALLEERGGVEADETLSVVDLPKDVLEGLVGIDEGPPLGRVVVDELLIAPLKVVNLWRKVGGFKWVPHSLNLAADLLLKPAIKAQITVRSDMYYESEEIVLISFIT